MSFTDYLPSTPAALSKLELWLWIVAACLTVLAPLVGFVARNVGQHRAALERQDLQAKFDADKAQLQTRLEKDKSDLVQELRRRDDKAKELEHLANDLSEKQEPRRITALQHEQFRRFLENAPKGPVGVASLLGDLESKEFALDVKRLLIDAGFTIAREVQVTIQPPPKGLTIRMHSLNTAPPHGLPLQKALQAIGLGSGPWINSTDTAPNEVDVIVGYKPQD